MDRKQAIAVVIMTSLILAGMIGIYYGLWMAYQTYKDNADKITSNPLYKLFGGG